MLKQNENNLFRDRQETVRGLWCEDLAYNWLQHNKHSRHISGVHGNIISAVIVIKLKQRFPVMLHVHVCSDESEC